MTVLANVWTFVWGTLTVAPFLGLPLVYLLVYAWKRDKRVAGRWAVNITNFLLIRTVIAAYGLIWPQAMSAWWWVICFFLVTIVLLGWVQVKWRGKLSLKKVGFSAWRLSFLWFGLVYVLLVTTGIFKTMSVV